MKLMALVTVQAEVANTVRKREYSIIERWECRYGFLDFFFVALTL